MTEEQEGARTPAIRASDAERDHTLALLRDAVGEGRLTLEELAERAERALAASTRAELAAVVADLPVEPLPREPARRGPTSWLVSVMGGNDRSGRWRIAQRCTVINFMGGNSIDLREAIVDDTEIEIWVWSLMGGSDIIVPEGVHVDAGGFAFMGGNDYRVEGPQPPPGAPVVKVRAYSLMGGTDIRTKPARRRG